MLYKKSECVLKCEEKCNKPGFLKRMSSFFIFPKQDNQPFTEASKPLLEKPEAQPLEPENKNPYNLDVSNETELFLHENSKKQESIWEKVKDFFRPDSKKNTNNFL